MAKYLLHYGGQTFETDDAVLDDIRTDEGELAEGALQFRLADNRWLTIVIGPGIPIALEEKPGSAVWA